MRSGESFEVRLSLLQFQCFVFILVTLVVALIFIAKENFVLMERVGVLEARECSVINDVWAGEESAPVIIDEKLRKHLD